MRSAVGCRTGIPPATFSLGYCCSQELGPFLSRGSVSRCCSRSQGRLTIHAGVPVLAPPAFGLSGVLPAMLRLAIYNLEYLGRHTGRMIALSTVGSLLGTWGTAFFLLSWIGSQALVAWLGAIQIGLGLWWLLRATTARPLTSGALALCAIGLGAGALHPVQVLKTPVYQEVSPYQQVRIRDDDLFRYLVLDR